MDFIAIPLGKLMHFIYFNFSFENYGLAIVIFTVLTKILLFPLTLKQLKSTAKMQQLSPKLEDLRRQYGTDKEKLNEETMKLYQTEGINPMSSCLPLLIQMPIVISLYRVVTSPLKYMFSKTAEQIQTIQEVFSSFLAETPRYFQDMEMLNFFKVNPQHMDKVSGVLNNGELLNMNFLGLDLSKVPTYNPSILFGPDKWVYIPLLLIPIIGVVSTFISSRLSMPPTDPNQSQAAGVNKSMMWTGPIMTFIFSFQLPAGVLVYWISGYLIQIVQQLFINKLILKPVQKSNAPNLVKNKNIEENGSDQEDKKADIVPELATIAVQSEGIENQSHSEEKDISKKYVDTRSSTNKNYGSTKKKKKK